MHKDVRRLNNSAVAYGGVGRICQVIECHRRESADKARDGKP